MRLLNDIRKWKKLDARKKLAWVKAAIVLSLIGIGLRLMSFHTFKKWYSKFSTFYPIQATRDESQVEDVVWAVKSAAHALPIKLLCLPQSLAVKYLLGKSEGVVMHIGVNKSDGKELLFHAWIEQEGKTIIGDLPAYYQPIWVWD